VNGESRKGVNKEKGFQECKEVRGWNGDGERMNPSLTLDRNSVPEGKTRTFLALLGGGPWKHQRKKGYGNPKEKHDGHGRGLSVRERQPGKKRKAQIKTF